MISRTNHKLKKGKYLKMNYIIRVKKEINRRYMIPFGEDGNTNVTI